MTVYWKQKGDHSFDNVGGCSRIFWKRGSSMSCCKLSIGERHFPNSDIMVSRMPISYSIWPDQILPRLWGRKCDQQIHHLLINGWFGGHVPFLWDSWALVTSNAPFWNPEGLGESHYPQGSWQIGRFPSFKPFLSSFWGICQNAEDHRTRGAENMGEIGFLSNST